MVASVGIKERRGSSKKSSDVRCQCDARILVVLQPYGARRVASMRSFIIFTTAIRFTYEAATSFQMTDCINIISNKTTDIGGPDQYGRQQNHTHIITKRGTDLVIPTITRQLITSIKST